MEYKLPRKPQLGPVLADIQQQVTCASNWVRQEQCLTAPRVWAYRTNSRQRSNSKGVKLPVGKPDDRERAHAGWTAHLKDDGNCRPKALSSLCAGGQSDTQVPDSTHGFSDSEGGGSAQQ